MSIFVNAQDAAFAVKTFRLAKTRMRVIDNGIAPWFLGVPDIQRRSSGPLKLAFVGAWSERKGMDALTDCMNALARDDVDFEATLVGTGGDPQSILWRFSAAARSRIDVQSYYENRDLPSLLAGREIVLFLSRSEGFGLTLIEAMACGLAPIATPVGIAPVAIKAGQTGYFVGIDAGEEAAGVVKMLAGNRDRLFSARLAAQRTARAYDWERIGRTTLQAYSDALSLKPSSSRRAAAGHAQQ